MRLEGSFIEANMICNLQMTILIPPSSSASDFISGENEVYLNLIFCGMANLSKVWLLNA